MNVHFLIPGDYQTLTGGNIYNRNIIKGLKDRGYEIILNELEDDFPFPNEKTLARCRAVLNNIPQGEPIVIDSLALGSLLPVLMDFYGKYPIISLIHIPFAFNEDIAATQRDILAQQEKNVLTMSSAIVVTSNYTAKIISGWLKFPPSIYVVPPGVEFERRKFYWPPYPQRLICVSNYMPNKGQYILLKALTSLKKLNWKLTCYGNKNFNPRYVDSLLSVVDKYGLGDRVLINNSVSGKELENAYLDSDICVLPSYFETYGMVLSEALAHGIPVIASTGGGIRDTVPISMGLFFKPGDISELQSVIRSILTDSWLYQRLSSETALYYKKAITWKDSVNKFDEIIKEVIQNFK
jgi:glycosyltransferase involved in cell wall biosynthesis